MRAGTIFDAARAGHPAVIAVGVLLLLTAVGVVWLWRRSRPIYPPRGSLTVAKIQEREARAQAARARHDEEIQAACVKTRYAEFRRQAEAQAQQRASAAEVTDVFPAIAADAPTESIPAPRTPPLRARPYLNIVSWPAEERSGVAR